MADANDNCVSTPNPGQVDTDGDGRGDPCDVCPQDPFDDADGDGICGNVDACSATVLPDGVPTRRLGRNRWADVDVDGVFETDEPPGRGPNRSYTIEDTHGCTCAQIIAARGLIRRSLTM